MLEELTHEQWVEWLNYMEIEPWGFDVADSFNAQLAVTMARAWGADVSAEDFLLGPRIPARVAPEDEAPDPAEQVKRMFGHRDVVKRGPRREG